MLSVFRRKHKGIYRHARERCYIVERPALLAAYAQCGQMSKCGNLFGCMPERDVVSWTAVISAYAQAGQPQMALQLFNEMNLVGHPDGICFASVLGAWSHRGAVRGGCHCFTSMTCDFGLVASGQHYSCMLSLLCSAGHLTDAQALMAAMPFAPSALDWRCFAAACRGGHYSSKDGLAVASQAAMQAEPGVGSPYVMLSNMCRAATVV
ncbi:pentatricopeptide repeat-containing protein At2g13600-like [Selaginella moellendorffii]|uniref:pentatricopeptide repeat-containing protein At2g13600-like n=1 Tax=Selaginella moellendorffii TaxID=88036 RepID=UPI000D1C95B0|nr:pentatricopeptide repeat-containing protein At2g13600-like [Selaginella moellendorffii]|eukprot:XP_024542435.1 pentatricopeptide repeat-containing protein At2g13600-like [Selaginella moellendorffii]